MTEAWYYIERHLKAGASRLYGLYDNNGSDKTPDLWQDDSNGYRLASVAQSQREANDNAVDNFLSSLRGLGFDTLQYDAFRYAIAVTGEPQFVSISDAQDNHGHAILAYRVDPSGIFVADPNYPASPAALRLIPFDPASGKFGTYSSGESALAVASGDVSYTNFVYKAKTALVDWSALTDDWLAFDDDKIGVGRFPVYSLEALAGKDAQGQDVWVPLADGYQMASSELTLRIQGVSDYTRLTLYSGTSSTPVAPAKGTITIQLKEGENPLGIYEEGAKPPGNDFEYVDFVRLTVIAGAAPSPSPTLTATPTPAATPVATPTATFDCSPGTRPSDLSGRIDWDLHCQAIQP